MRSAPREVIMGIGVSLILIAVGAILTWAVETTVSGVDIHAVGVILMVVGGAGLAISLAFWSSWGQVLQVGDAARPRPSTTRLPATERLRGRR